MQHSSPLLERMAQLETRLRRTQLALVMGVASAAGALMVGFGAHQPPGPEVADELRARRLVVVDDQNVARVVIGQDPKDTQRRSRSAGIVILDRHGDERGGMGTFDDDSVIMALDAPKGVGHPMRDRLGMGVNAAGGSHLMLLDNLTRAVVRLHSEGDGAGGVQLFKWDMDQKQIHIKTLTHAGEERSTMAMGEEK